MKNNKKNINLKDLSKLCENLHCTPNDLFYWENTGHSQVQDQHPLVTQLIKPNKLSNWNNLFKHLPNDKILELHKQATEMIEKK